MFLQLSFQGGKKNTLLVAYLCILCWYCTVWLRILYTLYMDTCLLAVSFLSFQLCVCLDTAEVWFLHFSLSVSVCLCFICILFVTIIWTCIILVRFINQNYSGISWCHWTTRTSLANLYVVTIFTYNLYHLHFWYWFGFLHDMIRVKARHLMVLLQVCLRYVSTPLGSSSFYKLTSGYSYRSFFW